MFLFNITHVNSYLSNSKDDLGQYEFTELKKSALRRLSKISQIALDLASKSIAEEEIDFIVYASKHGELQYSYDIMSDLIQGKPASPSKFSHSVHNSTASQLTILKKLNIPVTAISSGQDNIVSGMISALNYSKANDNKKALLIYADAAVPEKYQGKVLDENNNIVFTCILQTHNAGSYQLEIGQADQKTNTVNNESDIINWIMGDKNLDFYTQNKSYSLKKLEKEEL